MEGHKKCTLCHNIITDGNFRVIGDVIKNIFNLLLLKLTLHDDTQNVMCMACSSKLLATLSFKLTCLYMDNNIIPYVNFDAKPVDLKEIYAKGSKQETSVLDNLEVCRLCLQPTSSDHKSIEEVPVDSIQIYIPEINFAVTTNPVICTKCHDALCVHSSFIKNCLEVEKERNTVAMDVEDILLTNSSIKTEEIEIKPEPVDEEILFEILCDIKDKDHEERDKSLHSQNDLVGTEGTKSLNDPQDVKETSAESTSANRDSERPHKTGGDVQRNKSKGAGKDKAKTRRLKQEKPSEARMHKCDECDYKSAQKSNLKTHQSRHQDPSEVRTYKCDECDYKSLQKVQLKAHQVTHKDASEVEMYSCDECTFVTKHKRSVALHQMTHKDPSDMRMYACDECDYKSFRGKDLKRHQLRHRDPSEVRTYTCDTCEFETKHRQSIVSHMLVHKRPSEVQMYMCDECDFKSRDKSNLRVHMLKHKDPSEVTMYMCDECDYKSAQKRSVKRHQLKHKHPSEVQMYRCNKCPFQSKYKTSFYTHLLKHTS